MEKQNPNNEPFELTNDFGGKPVRVPKQLDADIAETHPEQERGGDETC